MMSEPRENPPHRSIFAIWRLGRWKIWTLATVLLISSYVFGVGPTVWMYNQGYLPAWSMDVVRIFYWPLEELDRNTDFGKATIGRYVAFWKPPITEADRPPTPLPSPSLPPNVGLPTESVSE